MDPEVASQAVTWASAFRDVGLALITMVGVGVFFIAIFGSLK